MSASHWNAFFFIRNWTISNGKCFLKSIQSASNMFVDNIEITMKPNEPIGRYVNHKKSEATMPSMRINTIFFPFIILTVLLCVRVYIFDEQMKNA